MAVRLAAERMTDEGKHTLRGALEQMRQAVDRADRVAAMESDWEFHRLVMQLSEHHLLQTVYRPLELQTRLFLVWTDRCHLDLSHLLPLPQPLAEAIIAGDPILAGHLASDLNTADREWLIHSLRRAQADVDAIPREPGVSD